MDSALVVPTGSAERRTFSLAARGATSLDGKVVGLLDSTKFNSGHLLDGIADELGKRYAVAEFVRDRKDYFGRPIVDEHARTLASRCDVVITAIGD